MKTFCCYTQIKFCTEENVEINIPKFVIPIKITPQIEYVNFYHLNQTALLPIDTEQAAVHDLQCKRRQQIWLSPRESSNSF